MSRDWLMHRGAEQEGGNEKGLFCCALGSQLGKMSGLESQHGTLPCILSGGC